MAAPRDYRSAEKPAPLPTWMTNFDAHDQQQLGAISGSYRPPFAGYADADQFQFSGIPDAWSPSGTPTHDPGPIPNGNQGLTSINPRGRAVEGTPPTFWDDRLPRAINGALTGFDWGNGVANAGVGAAASFVPGGQIVNSGAGAVQGYKSNALDFNEVLPEGGNSAGPSISQPDVMPRGIYSGGGGLLDPNSGGGTNVSNPFQPGAGGAGMPHPGFAANPIASRPLVPGQKAPNATPTGSGFTGGSGALVDPYELPGEDTLESLLANAQRYNTYDASTGRVGASGDGVGGYSSRGFDFAQDAGNRDVGKSAKYAFAHLAKQASAAGVPQPRTKEEGEAWFNQYIAPGLGQLGYAVEWVKGDKARIRTREGIDEIDYLGNAGGEGEVPLTWQSEILAPGPGMQGGGMGAGMGAGSLPASGTDLGSSALFDMLMQQARDIAAGKSNSASILDTNALVQLLGGK